MMPKVLVDYRPHPMPHEEYSSIYGSKKRSTGVELDQTLFSAKKERSKVFTGRRNIFFKDVPTLFDSCLRVLCDNIDGIGYTGGVPYDILRPILEKANAEQLFRMEDFNPYLAEDTDGLWKTLALRDFKGADRQELESWREVYERHLDERERKLEKVKNNIGAHKITQDNSRKAILAVVKTPREIRRKQEKFGTGRSKLCTTEQLLQHKRSLDARVVSNSSASSNRGGASGGVPPVGTGRASAGGSHCNKSGNNWSFGGAPSKKRKAVAPLMAKTLKMLKNARR